MVRLLVNLVVLALLSLSFVAIYKSTIFAFDHLKDVKDSKEVSSPCAAADKNITLPYSKLVVTRQLPSVWQVTWDRGDSREWQGESVNGV